MAVEADTAAVAVATSVAVVTLAAVVTLVAEWVVAISAAAILVVDLAAPVDWQAAVLEPAPMDWRAVILVAAPMESWAA